MKKLGLIRTKEELALIKRKNSQRLLKAGKITMPPPISLPIGTFRMKPGGDGRNNLWFKTEGGWVIYKCYLYELHFGPIPSGKAVRLIDGNDENVVIENLEVYDKLEAAHDALTNLSDNAVLLLLRRQNPELYDEKTIEQLKRSGSDIIEIKRLQIQLKRKSSSVKKGSRQSNEIWSDEQILFLKQNYGIEPMRYICKLLGKKYNNVFFKVKALGLKGPNIKIWGKTAIDIVKNNIENHDNAEVADILNRQLPNYHVKFTAKKVKQLLDRSDIKRSTKAVTRILCIKTTLRWKRQKRK